MASAHRLRSLVAAAPSAAQGEVSFSEYSEPRLAQRCTVGHGPALQRNGLRLDRRNRALHGDRRFQ